MLINLIMMLIASTVFIVLTKQGLTVIEKYCISDITIHYPKVGAWAIALSIIIAYVQEELPIVIWELFR
jgi:hypothetical protein